MTQDEINKKISSKEDKIVGMSTATSKTQDLLRDLKVLYEEKMRMALEERDKNDNEEVEDLKKQLAEAKAKAEKPRPVEAMHFCIPKSEVVDEYDMGACAVTKTVTGYEWRAKGGFRIYTENTNASLAGAMESYFEMRDQKDVLSPEEQDKQEQIMSALTYVLNYPMIAFSDDEFLLQMATAIVKWMNNKYKELVEDAELKPDDDPERTRDFQEATLAVEELREQMEKQPTEVEE